MTINEKLDIKGGILFALTIILLFGALTYGKEVGLNNPIIILCFVLCDYIICNFYTVTKKNRSAFIKS